MEIPEVRVNGAELSLAGVSPHVNLLDWLRGQGLVGAKEGCAEGECGACSVLVARPDGDGVRWVAVNACLPPALSFAGQEVITSEGLGTPAHLHPVQAGMAHAGGSQCGYCTPGFVTSMAAEYYRPERAQEDGEFDLEALSGNLCRCTGYRPIKDAAQALGLPDEQDPLARRLQQPAPPVPTVHVEVDGAEYLRPADLAEAVAALAADPQAVLVAGGTDLGVLTNILGMRPQRRIAVDRLPELRVLSLPGQSSNGHGSADRSVEIGAALTLTEIESALAGRIPLLAQLIPQFASRLIRNAATIGGNLGTASPIGDCAPALLALDASVVLAGPGGSREVALSEYFTGYRQTVRRPDELIVSVRIPEPIGPAPLTAFHKIAKRRYDDISSVAVAFAIQLDEAGTVTRARIGLGGVAATPLRAVAAEELLTGRAWTAQTVEQAAEVLGSTGTPMTDHRASEDYRRAMLRMALPRFHAELTEASR